MDYMVTPSFIGTTLCTLFEDGVPGFNCNKLSLIVTYLLF